jgi:ribose-phosphate pyrophosphokinase
MFMNRPFKIFSGRSSRKIALAICKAYGTELGDETVIEFSDGEFEPSFDESIRGADIFLVQSTMPPADNLMELLLMIDAARRASAYKINAVIPYFGYARQDKKGKPRVPIGAKLIANLLTSAGVDRVLNYGLTCRSNSRVF